MDRKLWKDMTKAISLEEHAGEVPRPIPRPPGPETWMQLPQQGVGYYVYGTDQTDRPGTTAKAQWGYPETIKFIQDVGATLAKGKEPTPFGVGNVSLQGGGEFKPHGWHRDGLGIDVRPARIDGRPVRVDYLSKDYDRAATRRLIETIRATNQAESVFFNDPELIDDPDLKGFVRRSDGHNDHFHVQLKW